MCVEFTTPPRRTLSFIPTACSVSLLAEPNVHFCIVLSASSSESVRAGLVVGSGSVGRPKSHEWHSCCWCCWWYSFIAFVLPPPANAALNASHVLVWGETNAASAAAGN